MFKESFEEVGTYFHRDGVAKERGMRNLCRKRLCIISTDLDFLFGMMHEASLANDCYEVKIYKTERLGAFYAYCYFTNESSLGDAWARYESHPKAWAVIHDDEFCDTFKSRIRSY